MSTSLEIARTQLAAISAQHGGLKAIRSKLLGDLLPLRMQRLLVAEGYLLSITAGWYIHWSPQAALGDSREWADGLHDFIIDFGNSWFGSNWCASANTSLQLYAGAKFSNHITLNATSKAGKTRELIDGTKIFISVADRLPSQADRSSVRGLPTYSLPDALAYASTAFLKSNPDIFESAITKLKDFSALTARLEANNSFLRATLIGEKLIECGRADLAKQLRFRSAEAPLPDASKDVAANPTIGIDSPRAFKSTTIKPALRKKLLDEQHLLTITKDWCISWHPSAKIEVSKEWREGLRAFLIAFGNAMLTSEWALSPEISLRMHLGAQLPESIVLHNAKQSWKRDLCGVHTLKITTTLNFPSARDRSTVFGMPVYSLEASIIRASAPFLAANSQLLFEALCKLSNADELVRCQLEFGTKARFRLLEQALMDCGRPKLAQQFRDGVAAMTPVAADEGAHRAQPTPSKTASKLAAIDWQAARRSENNTLLMDEIVSRLGGICAFRSDAIPHDLHARLIEKRYLLEIAPGWSIRWRPTAAVGTSKEWSDGFRDFLLAFGDEKLAGDWCMNPNLSLLLYADEKLPKKIALISSRRANPCRLVDGTIVTASVVTRLPTPAQRFFKNRIPVYALEDAIVYATNEFLATHPDVLNTCLLALEDVSSLSRRLKEVKNLARVSLIDKTLIRLGRSDLAQKLRGPIVAAQALGLGDPTPRHLVESHGELSVFKTDTLPKNRRQNLIHRKYLLTISKGWDILWTPNSVIGDSPEWDRGLHDFLVMFCDDRFKNVWCATPSLSLILHLGRKLPQQISLHTKTKHHITRQIAGNFYLDVLPIENFPDYSSRTSVDGIEVYEIEEALTRITQDHLRLHRELVKEALINLVCLDELTRRLANAKKLRRLEYFRQMLVECGQQELADKIPGTRREMRRFASRRLRSRRGTEIDSLLWLAEDKVDAVWSRRRAEVAGSSSDTSSTSLRNREAVNILSQRIGLATMLGMPLSLESRRSTKAR